MTPPPRSPPHPSAPVTAFVLSGGGSIGAAQAGMLRALYESGVTPDLIVGTSAGALNAVFIASRPQTVATARELERVWAGLTRDSVFPLSPRLVLAGLSNIRDHLVPDRGLRSLAARHLQFERLEDAFVPVHLVAFDLLSGTEVRLSSGPALEAVLAAAAIPGVLPPVPWQGRLLVDGGVVDNTPISHAVELGAQRIFVLTTDDPAGHAMPAPPRGALDAAVHAFTLLISTRLVPDIVRYRDEVELIVLPATNPQHVSPTDFGHAAILAHASLDSSRTLLQATLTTEPLAA